MKKILLLLFILPAFIYAQDFSLIESKMWQDITQKDSLTFIFIGDIMGHEPQIQSAFDTENEKYNYEGVFKRVSHIIKNADFAIANLEVTLAGKPYTGYPKFSSPDALAAACKNNGIDVLVTANNHSCDKGKKGILRTIKVLDSLNFLFD